MRMILILNKARCANPQLSHVPIQNRHTVCRSCDRSPRLCMVVLPTGARQRPAPIKRPPKPQQWTPDIVSLCVAHNALWSYVMCSAGNAPRSSLSPLLLCPTPPAAISGSFPIGSQAFSSSAALMLPRSMPSLNAPTAPPHSPRCANDQHPSPSPSRAPR